MATDEVDEADELDALRARIDDLNRRLRDLLQERARAVVDVAAWKARHGVPIADAAREAAMLDAVLDDVGPRGAGQGFDRAALARLFRAVFAESRALAERSAGRR